MSDVHYKKHVVFRETEDVIFYDITVEESNASDLVVHTGAAVSPPNDNRQEIIDSLKKMQKDILTNIQRLDTESMDTFNQYIPIIYIYVNY